MSNRTRPISASLLTALALIGGLLTGYFGLSANGYLIPAAMLMVVAALLWLGRLGQFVRAVALLNLVSGLILIVVLAFGEVLGDRKLDISGVALLVNLLAGGPLLGLIAAPLLWHLRSEGRLVAWFKPAAAA